MGHHSRANSSLHRAGSPITHMITDIMAQTWVRHLADTNIKHFVSTLTCSVDKYFAYGTVYIVTLIKNGRWILCLWFRASLIYINNSPTRWKTKQSIYYSASSLYMFRVSTTPIIRNTQNCNYSLRYCAATSFQCGQAWPRWREVAAQYRKL